MRALQGDAPVHREQSPRDSLVLHTTTRTAQKEDHECGRPLKEMLDIHTRSAHMTAYEAAICIIMTDSSDESHTRLDQRM